MLSRAVDRSLSHSIPLWPSNMRDAATPVAKPRPLSSASAERSNAALRTLGSQHAVSVRVVKTLGVPSLAWIISLEPLYIAVTAISQRILFWIEGALLTPNLVQAIHLIDGPIQTALQALYDRLKLPVHRRADSR